MAALSEGGALLAAATQLSQHSESHELEQARIERVRPLIRKAVTARLGGVREDLLIGSYARGTAVRPFQSIDLVLVLEDHVHWRQIGAGPGWLLRELRAAVGEHPDQLVAAKPRHRGLVYVELAAGHQIGFELRPAFREPYVLHGLSIPARSGERWLRTSPQALNDALRSAEERLGPQLRPALRLLRLWQRGLREAPRPLHLELLALTCTTGADQVLDLLQQLLGAVAAGVVRRAAALVDNLPIDGELDEALTLAARHQIRAQAEQARRVLDRARAAEARGDQEESGRLWHSLFP